MGFRTFARLVLPQAPDVLQLPPTGLRSAAAASRYRALLPWLDVLVRAWERYIETGGYPVAVAATVAGRPTPEGFVTDLFDIVANDAFRTSRLGAPRELALLERLWGTITSFASQAAIGDDLGISRDVVARHMDFLENAYLLWHCPQRAEHGWVARERSQSKIYAVDPLIARLPHLRSPERRDIDPTALTEMQIGNAIRRRLLAAPGSMSTPVDRFLFHVRTPSRKEVDFVGEGIGEVAIEGKYTEGSWKAEAATVNASAWAGILVTRNVLDIPSDEDDPGQAWAVPAGLLAYLLDT
jgi:predicted AAA+ superfamily ATPase